MKYLGIIFMISSVSIGCGSSAPSSSKSTNHVPEMSQHRIQKVRESVFEKIKNRSVVSVMVSVLAREYTDSAVEPELIIAQLNPVMKLQCQRGECIARKIGEIK